MTAIVQHLTPSLFQLLGLVGLLLASLMMLVFGALVGGPRRLAEADLVVGWAVLSSVLVIIGVAAPLGFLGSKRMTVTARFRASIVAPCVAWTAISWVRFSGGQYSFPPA